MFQAVSVFGISLCNLLVKTYEVSNCVWHLPSREHILSLPPIIVMQSFILSCNLIVSTYLAIGLFYVQSNIQVATETTTIIEALNKFVTHRISALPIVVRSTTFYNSANCKTRIFYFVGR